MQEIVMKTDPAFGTNRPYPSHAKQWREYQGLLAWLFNPWNGCRRHSTDIGADPFGFLIIPQDVNLVAATGTQCVGGKLGVYSNMGRNINKK